MPRPASKPAYSITDQRNGNYVVYNGTTRVAKGSPDLHFIFNAPSREAFHVDGLDDWAQDSMFEMLMLGLFTKASKQVKNDNNTMISRNGKMVDALTQSRKYIAGCLNMGYRLPWKKVDGKKVQVIPAKILAIEKAAVAANFVTKSVDDEGEVMFTPVPQAEIVKPNGKK